MRFVIALLTALLTLPGTLHALTVDEIVAKNIAARGGEANLKAIRSLRLTGKVSFSFGDNQIEAGWGQLQKRPGLFRTETTLQGLTAVEASDGKEGWNLQPFQGRRDAQKESADESRQLAEQADIEGPLVDWKEKGHVVEYLGTEDVDGTLALKLRVNLKGGNTEYIYLDPDYYLEIRTETVTRVRGAETITDTDLGSYQQVDGVWFPFSLEQSQPGGGGKQRYSVESAEANVDADDSLFAFPPAGTPIVQSIKAGPKTRDGRGFGRSGPRLRPSARLRLRDSLGARREEHRVRGDERTRRGRHRPHRRREDDALRRRRERRRVAFVRRRHDVQADLRQGARAVDRGDHDRSVEPEDRLGRNGRIVDAQLRLGRRRDLQVDRRRRNLEEHGAAEFRAHRPRARASEAERHRLRMRPGEALERQRRPRAVQDD